MDHWLWGMLALLALAGCAGRGSTPTPAPPTPGCLMLPETEQLGADFRELRAQQGHYQGGPWSADLDAWMGRKHQVMIELGTRLGTGDCARDQILDRLGAPDTVAHQGEILFDLVTRSPEFRPPAAGPFELLIYYWRGAHDLLYLVAQGEAVLSSGWWYAYE